MSPDISPSNEGIIIELLRDIYKEAGYKISIRWTNLPRAIQQTVSGQSDAICSLNDRTASKEIDLIRTRLINSRVAVIVRKSDKLIYKGVKSLADRVVGNIEGFIYEDSSPAYQAMLDSGPNKVVALSGEDSFQRLFNLISKSRVDVFAVNLEILYFTFDRKYINENFRIAGYLENNLIGYFGVSSKSEKALEIKTIFQSKIRQKLKSNSFRKIVNKYQKN